MENALNSVRSKVREYRFDIKDKERRINRMRNVMDNYNALYKRTDKELRVSASNQRINNKNAFFPGPVSRFEGDYNMKSTLVFGKDHLRAMQDPLVDSIVMLFEMYEDTVRSGELYDETLLHRIIWRSMDMGEYIDLLSGKKAIGTYEGDEVYLPVPENIGGIVSGLMMSHNGVSYGADTS